MTVPTSSADPHVSPGQDPHPDRQRLDSVGGHPWKRRDRPLRLERRLEFADYETLRAFLDQAGDLSEQTGIYPNLSFGRSYVNLTLFADEDSLELSADAERFAREIDGMVNTLEDEQQ